MATHEPDSPQVGFHDESHFPHVPVSQTPTDKFREFLEVQGLKCTGERMRLVEHVFSRHNHFDADQLITSVKENKIRVSRSTIYRTLKMLVEAGLLRELQFGDRKAYEHDYGYPQHEHLYCEKCGAVIEFVSEELDRLLETISNHYRFRQRMHRLIIHGACEKCNRGSSNARKLDLI